MKILYAAQKYLLQQGSGPLTTEYVDLYEALKQLPGAEVDYYDTGRFREIGNEAVSLELKQRVEATRPDVFFIWLSRELNISVFKEVKEKTGIVTIAFLADEDTDLYTRDRAWLTAFDWLAMNYPPAFEEYRKMGLNVLGINCAANTDFFKPVTDVAEDIDVSFLGAAKPERKDFVAKLRAAGINVQTWGPGWPNGPFRSEDQISLYARSKINLNLGFGKPIWNLRTLARVFLFPAQNRFGFVFDPRRILDNIRTIAIRRKPQWRGRPFDVLACNVFLMTNRAPAFGDPYVENKEVVFYDDADDAIKKIKYYLASEHEAERHAIARAGYERTLRDHLWTKRMKDMFDFIFAGGDAKPKKPRAKVLI
jgi:spore maturation protein CgeB